MKYFSMFSGIGGFELGFPENWECIGQSEIEPNCCKLLKQKFRGIKNYGDATTINPNELPDFDLFCGRFPCQSFSIAGKRRGFEDTRGTMFFEIARVLKVKKPSYFLLENVKGLLNHDKGNTFTKIIQTLDELGYGTQWMVLNSKFFGVPQNRERVFIIGHIRKSSRPKILPYRETNKDNKIKEINHGFHVYRTYSPMGISPTIMRCHRGGMNGVKIEFNTGNIRFLTPLEYERLQGFPDHWTEGFENIVRYEMLGNAVTVNVINYIAEQIQRGIKKMSHKEANNEYIKKEEVEYLGGEIGDNFIEPKEQIAGYENMEVELLGGSDYEEWINCATYASLVTWDMTPHNPITNLNNKTFEEKEQRLLYMLSKRPISVALESAVFTFKLINVPRSMTHQLVRHRQMAFGQQSYRVSSCYSDPVRIPQVLLEKNKNNDPNSERLIKRYIEAVELCRINYKAMIEAGVPMEQARNIMPMGTCTKIAVTMRLRDMIAYVGGRTSGIAQDEHTYMVCLMMQEMRLKKPRFFNLIKNKIRKLETLMGEYLGDTDETVSK